MNLSELAALCGCSPATVSKALRNAVGVNPETKARILNAARENGIRLSPEQLVRGKSVLICVPTFNNEMNARLLKHIMLTFEEVGVSVISTSWEFDRKRFRKLQHIARSISNLSGIICIDDTDDPELLSSIGVPVIFPGNYPDRDCIATDWDGGYRKTIRHLIEHGRRRIAYIGETHTAKKIDSFRRCMTDCGLPIDERLFYITNTYSSRAGAEGYAALMNLPEPPDAIVCAYDYIALGVLNSAEASGIVVPDELAVIGSDNIKAASTYRLGLTTLAVPPERRAEALLGLFIRRVRDPDAPPEKIVVPYELIVRGTA